MSVRTSTIIKVFVLSIVILATTIIPNSIVSTTVVDAATKRPSISEHIIELKVGQTHKFKIKNVPKKSTIKWKSLNKKVVTVSSKGVVKAVAVGHTNIRIQIKSPERTTELTSQIYVVPKEKKQKDEAGNNISVKFDANEAKEKITFTPVETCKNLYEVTSTYDFPTRVTVDYKIVDKEGVTVHKANEDVLITPWGKSYISIPSDFNENTVSTTYKYTDYSNNITKENFENIQNSIQIYKFEKDEKRSAYHTDASGNIFNADEKIYVYVKNTSEQTIKSGSIGLLIYNDQGQIFECLDNAIAVNNIEPNEIIKNEININQYYNIQNISDIQFYVSGF